MGRAGSGSDPRKHGTMLESEPGPPSGPCDPWTRPSSGNRAVVPVRQGSEPVSQEDLWDQTRSPDPCPQHISMHLLPATGTGPSRLGGVSGCQGWVLKRAAICQSWFLGTEGGACRPDDTRDTKVSPKRRRRLLIQPGPRRPRRGSHDQRAENC